MEHGGIVASFSIPINNCYNIGNVSGISYVGGIGGYTQSSDSIIDNCYNSGTIYALGSDVGGIVARGVEANYCYNIGKIVGLNDVGGIAGSCSPGSTGAITYCYNWGSVESETGYEIGGIAGWFHSTSGFNNSGLSYCYNIADIVGKSEVGGIAGMFSNSSLSHAYNLGIVGNSESTYTGGIIGDDSMTPILEYCINVAKVNGKSKVGGIAGSADVIAEEKITDCGFVSGMANFGVGNVESNDCEEITIYSSASSAPSLMSIIGTEYYKQDANYEYPILSWQTDNDELNLINGDNEFAQTEDGMVVLAWQLAENQ